MENRGQVPDNWFIDPLLLGVSGAYTDFEQDPLSWQADALCAQTDPEAFFPEKGLGGQKSVKLAKSMCKSCIYVTKCLQWAIDNNETGIWGGTTERERRYMRRTRAKIT